VSDEQAMQKAFQEQQRALHDHVDSAFRRSSLSEFSKILEEAHGWVHGVIGGGWDDKSPSGHMWPLEYSAYEPMFMLHHTYAAPITYHGIAVTDNSSNVDRLYAMYQGQNPNRNLEPSNIGSNGNVWLEDGTTVDADTPMLPFRKASGGFWTPNDVHSTETFGYAYPETFREVPHAEEEWEGENEEEEEEDDDEWRSSKAVSASIATLYSSSVRDMLTTSPATAGGFTQLTSNGTFTDWSIDTRASAHKLPSTFVVRFSLTSDFSSDPSVDVGSWVNIMPASHEQTRKRGAAIETTYNSSISLTASLLDQIKVGKLDSLEEKDVVPYLKDKLNWKVVNVSTIFETLQECF
jgi:tyrosinase